MTRARSWCRLAPSPRSTLGRKRSWTTIPVSARPGAVSAGERCDLGGEPGGQDADAPGSDEPRDRSHDRRSLPRRPASTSAWERCGWRTAAPGSSPASTPTFDRVTKTVDLVGRAVYAPTGSVVVGGGSVWAGIREVEARPCRSDRGEPRRGPRSRRWGHPVWPSTVAPYGSPAERTRQLRRYSPRTFRQGPLRTISRGNRAAQPRCERGCAVDCDHRRRRRGAHRRRLGCGPDDPVGDGPEALAVGADAVWVANRLGRARHRIDPETTRVETISVGNAPVGIAVDGRCCLGVGSGALSQADGR